MMNDFHLNSTTPQTISLHSVPKETECASKTKTGLYRLGLVANYPKKDKPSNCLTFLHKMTGNANISIDDINTYIESGDCKIEYLDTNGHSTTEETAVVKKFTLPYKDKYGGSIYGIFSRNDLNSDFKGVDWQSTSIISLFQYGKINLQSINDIRMLSQNEDITKSNIAAFINSNVEYLNISGYTQFGNGQPVSKENGTFARFKTTLKTESGDPIFIWFTKNPKGKYEGLNCGDEKRFKQSVSDRKRVFVGRMSFESKEACNSFLNALADSAMTEPWNYKNRKDPDFDCPILKSYLEYELDRLFFEHEELQKENKIVFNKDKTKILFNTNLLDKYASDINIFGDIKNIGGKTYISNPQQNRGGKHELRKLEFAGDTPLPPEFFKEIHEIIFHCEWEIDTNIENYTHIIEQRIERFPDKYRSSEVSALSNKLNNAIKFARKIAQRNYKFIVPMYYPPFHRIQLLMPIYLEESYNCQPDFALVFRPDPDTELYIPKTILGLEEVYQDARLIAKPDESWLNSTIINK